MYRKILVANDGSKGGEAAFRAAIELAKALGVGLTMICVEDLERFPATIDRVAEAQEAPSVFEDVVAAAKALAAAEGVALEALVVEGHPAPRILEFVERDGYDLLVLGYMGHSALYDRLIGGAASRLVALAPCKVMIVK